MMEAASAAEVPIWVMSYLSALRAESLSASCAGYKRQEDSTDEVYHRKSLLLLR